MIEETELIKNPGNLGELKLTDIFSGLTVNRGHFLKKTSCPVESNTVWRINESIDLVRWWFWWTSLLLTGLAKHGGQRKQGIHKMPVARFVWRVHRTPCSSNLIRTNIHLHIIIVHVPDNAECGKDLAVKFLSTSVLFLIPCDWDFILQEDIEEIFINTQMKSKSNIKHKCHLFSAIKSRITNTVIELYGKAVN